jgi:hypothetical protein
MALIQVTTSRPAVFHVGSVQVSPGKTATVEGDDAGVKKLLAAGKIVQIGGESEATEATVEGDDAADKDALLARAKELGIDAKGTWGVAKLQAAIAEAEEKAKATSGGES